MPGRPPLPRRAAAVAVAAAAVPLVWAGDWSLGAVLALFFARPSRTPVPAV